MINKRKVIAVVAVLILVFAVSIGYAYLSATFTINGSSKISGETWDLHFENYSQTANSTITPAAGKTPDTSGNNKTAISYEVEFEQPGDVYEFTIDVRNGGSVDAMIESFQTKIKIDDGEEQVLTNSNLPTYMSHSITYSDGVALANNQKIESEHSETLLVRVEFKKNISNEEFTAAKGRTIKFTFDLDCIQADGNAVAINHV